jgi:osmotically-inducible protein OsmY
MIASAQPGRQRGNALRPAPFTSAGYNHQEEAGMSDENRIRDEVASRMAKSLGAQAPQVQVDVVGDQVTLVGTLDSAEQRRQAEAVATGTPGVKFVVNNLRVAQEGTTGATG